MPVINLRETAPEMSTTAIGIEIDGRKVIACVLKKDDGEIENCTGNYKPIILENDDVAANVVLFRNSLFATFDAYNPSVIIIKARNPKGKGAYAPSPISFKVEGIIQTYEKCDVRLIAPQTVAAYFKKRTPVISPKFGYQEAAFNLAYHHLDSLQK